MKSQTKQMIVLAAVLAAVLAVYVGMRIWNGETEDADTAEDHAQDLVELTELSQLTFTTETGETLAFSKLEDTWSSSDEPELTMNQSLLGNIETQFCALTYQRALEEHEELSNYGLDPAARTITGTDDTGASCTILLGNEVDSEGIYYAMVEGGNVVYTVSGDLLNAISYGLMDLVQVESLPELTEDDIESISVSTSEGELTLSKVTEESQETQEQETGEVDENGDPVMEEVTVTVETYRWYLSDGAEIPEGNAALSSVLDELSALSFAGAYAFQPTDEELANMGLGESATILTVNCADGTQLRLELGAPDETGENCYARLEESNLIYMMLVSDVDDLLAMTEESLTAAAE